MDIAIHALAGILLGGLVNALADNLPQGRLLALPRYSDGSPRPLIAWLGLSAFLLGRRHAGTGDCAEKLSWRHPLTELALAALLLTTHLVAGAKPQLSPGQQLLWQLYGVFFVLLALVDIEHKRILFLPVFVTSLLALLDAAVFPQHPPGLTSSLAGGLVGGMVFSLVYAGGQVYGRRLKHKSAKPTAFGKGDVYLMAMGGLIVGFPNVLVAMFGAVFLGGAGALAYIVGTHLLGERYVRFTALPYGPYILGAVCFVMLFPNAFGLGT